MSNRLTKELALDALKMAICNNPETKGNIHHSDRGSQYARLEYQTRRLKPASLIT